MVKVKINDKVFEFKIKKPEQKFIDGNFLVAECYDYKGGELRVTPNCDYVSAYFDACGEKLGYYEDFETEDDLYQAVVEVFDNFGANDSLYAAGGTVSKVYYLNDNKASEVSKTILQYAQIIDLQNECKKSKIEILD